MARAPYLVIASVLLSMALPGWASSHQEDPRGERLDAAIAKVQTKAARLDANSDGWLSDEETASGRDKLGALHGAISRRVDENKDGRVSTQEYIEAQVKALEVADVNQDGWISPDEASAQKRRLIMDLLRGQ